MSRLVRILIALDQLLGTIFLPNHMPDETISSRCWRWEKDGVRSWPRKLVDALFFWDERHCEQSYYSEKQGLQQAEELRPPGGDHGA